MGHRSKGLSNLELGFVEGGVKALELEELIVGAALHHAAVFDHQDAVHMLDG